METRVIVIANLGGFLMMSTSATSKVGRQRRPALTARSCIRRSCVSELLRVRRHGHLGWIGFTTVFTATAAPLYGAGSLLTGDVRPFQPWRSVALERPIAAENQPVPWFMAAAQAVCGQAASNDDNHSSFLHLRIQESTSPRTFKGRNPGHRPRQSGRPLPTFRRTDPSTGMLS